MSDVELARQTQAGSMTAFEQLVYRYEKRIYSFVFQRCRNSEDAREIAQDAFVKAYHAINSFDPDHEFAPWLFTIARRKCIDHLRSLPPCPAAVPEITDADSPVELLAREEDNRAIWKLAARHLAPGQFEALWLRYAEDMNVAAVARVLGKTQTHVKVLLFRARKTLARFLRPASLTAHGAVEQSLPPPQSQMERTPL